MLPRPGISRTWQSPEHATFRRSNISPRHTISPQTRRRERTRERREKPDSASKPPVREKRENPRATGQIPRTKSQPPGREKNHDIGEKQLQYPGLKIIPTWAKCFHMKSSQVTQPNWWLMKTTSWSFRRSKFKNEIWGSNKTCNVYWLLGRLRL